MFELPVEAAANVASDEAFVLKFVKRLAGSVLRNVDFVCRFAHRHRDLAVVEAVVALGESDIERPACGGQGQPGRALQKPMVKHDEASFADAPAGFVNSAATAWSFSVGAHLGLQSQLVRSYRRTMRAQIARS